MYRYIIVDDEALIRKGTLKKISPLSDLVTCIGEAENGSDALEQIEEKKPDFVIMDMQMPVMNGMELLPILAEKYPRMPLIVISGYKNFDYIKQAISANAVEYLLKPFSAQMIQDCIHQVLNRLEERTERDRQLKLTEEEAEQVRYEYDLTLLHNLIFGYRTAGTTLTSRKLNYINTTHDVLLINLCYPEPLDDSVLFQWLAENGFGDLGLYLSGRDTAQSQGFLILFLSQQAEKYQERLVKQVLDALELFLDSFAAETIIGVSLIHHSLSDLSQAYVEASHAPDAHILTDHRTHLFRFTKESTPQRLDWPRTDEFLFRLEAGMRGEIGPLCDDLFAYYLSVPSATLGDAKYHCASLSGYCRQLLNTYM
ncbi:MAG: response regulator, partial [Eubacterium sp.]|nr:response regulator [Eubacterium sp.]